MTKTYSRHLCLQAVQLPPHETTQDKAISVPISPLNRQCLLNPDLAPTWPWVLPQGQASPDTAKWAALLLLLPPGTQLLLSQGHLLLHGRCLFFSPSTILLEKGRSAAEAGSMPGPSSKDPGLWSYGPAPRAPFLLKLRTFCKIFKIDTGSFGLSPSPLSTLHVCVCVHVCGWMSTCTSWGRMVVVGSSPPSPLSTGSPLKLT